MPDDSGFRQAHLFYMSASGKGAAPYFDSPALYRIGFLPCGACYQQAAALAVQNISATFIARVLGVHPYRLKARAADEGIPVQPRQSIWKAYIQDGRTILKCPVVYLLDEVK
jgi:hypothetical protein